MRLVALVACASLGCAQSSPGTQSGARHRDLGAAAATAPEGGFFPPSDDLAAGPRDLGLLDGPARDLQRARDLDAPGSPPDLSRPHDLATHDLTAPRDLEEPPDLQRPHDLTSNGCGNVFQYSTCSTGGSCGGTQPPGSPCTHGSDCAPASCPCPSGGHAFLTALCSDGMCDQASACRCAEAFPTQSALALVCQ
jgi:hypothetical protein